MATVTPVPTLGPDGWITSTQARCDALFTDFLVAAHSQHPLETIDASLPWLLVRYQDDPRALEDNTVLVLERYYSNYFPKARASCTVRENANNPSHLDMIIRMLITDETGSSFELSKIAVVGEKRVISFATENNGSLPTQM